MAYAALARLFWLLLKFQVRNNSMIEEAVPAATRDIDLHVIILV